MTERYGASPPRRPRHRAVDQDEVATTLLPRVCPPDDATIVIPRIVPASEPVVPPPATPAPTLPAPEADPADPAVEPASDGVPAAPKGVKIVPLRPVRTDDGYRSVHSYLTRTTFGTVVRNTMRGTGELLITLGLVVLLFAAYEVWGKTAIVGAHQDDLNKQLAQDWGAGAPVVGPSESPAGAPPAGPPSGGAIARLYIPRMHKQWVVVQGVAPADIRYAPGHYPDTAMPGQVGNFSVAGHRTPAIFWDLDQVHSGDLIGVETRDKWYVYRVSQVEVVSPHAIQVVAPWPDHPGERPAKPMITLTTCNPKLDNYQRLVVHGELVRSQAHTAGKPAELGS
jgi:LPXTG-site transpeptidase (sortase) family protein